MIQLGKNQFDVPAPAGMQSFALQQRIVPVASRVVNVVAAVLGKHQSLEEVLAEDVVKLLPQVLPHVGHVFAEMPPGELEALTRALLGPDRGRPAGPANLGATCDGVPLFGAGVGGSDAFDAIMRGRALDTWQLLWHALRVWYPDFFSAAAMFAPKQDAAAASPSETPSTSAAPGPASSSSPKAGRRSKGLPY